MSENSLVIPFAGESYTVTGEDSIEHLKRVGDLANQQYDAIKAEFGVNQPPKEKALSLCVLNTAEVAIKLAEYAHSLQDKIEELNKQKERLEMRIAELEDEVLNLECMTEKIKEEE